MISDLEVKRAMNRLSAAFGPPRDDPNGTWEEYRKALRTSPSAQRLAITPDELTGAVDNFIATTEHTYGFPAPARITGIIRARRGSPVYTEPDRPRQKYEPGTFLRLLEAEGVDVDDLRARYERHKATSVRRGSLEDGAA